MVRPAVSVLLLMVASAQASEPHVHGLARLTVSLDEQTLTIALSSPLDNLAGFEHAPRTEAQKAALEHIVATLERPAELFLATAAAGCTPASTNIESPILEDHSSHDHEHHHDHDHDHHAHADLYAEYTFDCAQPARLNNLTVVLFEAFPRLERIDAEAALPGRQVAAGLEPDDNIFNLR
ncbi:DUF2796 domain-containing protein [Wenzhouxiangella sp. XN24]|uniref:DUF2796 domain-containing protein n=1 Tax=Wenzhouxiangella sp. XN24 TaxID=2713569 RepID=UPI0013ECCBFF|nr:DUF2796 domain-containing protein [Wenzhouxiangella sp. XN24]NGX16840.1 DUF2796 domain-containing protein [Wenzhouxiangella sp. XN24]